MKLRKHRAIPVFCEVDPSHVQNLKGNYKIKKQRWRDALNEIGNLSGFDSKNYSTDAELIDNIVDKVSVILCEICPSMSHNEGLFGIDQSIKDVEALLNIDSINDIKMVGIWGMGGIGKTTIASKVFDRNKSKFHGHCFISNVRETLSTRDGLINLRDKIIGEVLRDKDIKIDSSHVVDDSIRRRLARSKALLFLDDVLTCMQLKSLLEACGLYSPDAFCPRSRIIVTSRDSQVLQDVILQSYIYEVQHLKNIEALQLFSWHAFGQKYPQQGYERLSEEVVRYADGVPLALVVLGSELKLRETVYWEKALAKYGTTSPLGVQEILRTSITYGLDPEEKKIFLDIACFLKGFTRGYVENMLDTFGFHGKVGIDRLINKCLIKEEIEDEEVIITMHDLLEKMGREIVAEEKESKGNPSRLWTYADTKDALTNNKGTENVEAISLQHSYGDGIDINPQAFDHMCKLRYLKFKFDFLHQSINCPQGLDFLPNTIKYLHWDNFSQNHWPSNYYSENLVELHLKYSKLKEIVWSKPLVSLKLICLCGSKNLIKIWDWRMTPNLEVIDLGYCGRLIEVGSSLEKLNKLKRLNLLGCTSLSRLPELPCSIDDMELSWSGLRRLPSTVGGLTQLRKLSLSLCGELEILPESISRLIHLEVIDLNDCLRLIEIRSSLQHLKKLTRLDVIKCISLSLLPEIPSTIAELHLSRSGVKQLPSTIGYLTSLKELSLVSCEKLESLPSSICNLTSLESLDLSNCRNLQTLPEDFGNLKSLKELDASYGGLIALPSSVKKLKKLIKLDLTCCQELKFLPALPSNLELLYARSGKSLFNKVILSLIENYRWKVHRNPKTIHRLCLDDARQVPKWMKYHNDRGTSISLELKAVGCSLNFIFCVVVSKHFAPLHVFSIINPVAILTSENSETYKSFSHPEMHPQILHDRWEKQSYLFLWNCSVDCKFVKKVTFRLMNHSEEWGIIKCGVHQVHELFDKRSNQLL